MILDWKPNHDPRSRNYGISEQITAPVERKTTLWETGPILDQGDDGACVGYALVAHRNSTQQWTGKETAEHIYQQAKTLDPWEGEDYDYTSLVAGAKAAQQLGLIESYRWAFGLTEVIDALCSVGPVVLGLRWRAGMFKPKGGMVRAIGKTVGGHAVTAVGFTPESPFYDGGPTITIQNSWGTNWGMQGYAELPAADLALLLMASGEACIPVSRPA